MVKDIKNKLVNILYIAICYILLINTVVNAKYIMNKQFYIANIDIDRTKPKIELLDINNTNIGYENYANKTHIITARIKITDKNLKQVFCDKEHIRVKINNEYVKLDNMEFIKEKDLKEEKIYQIKLKNIEGNGKLKIEIIEGTAIDTSELKNDKVEIDTDIIIDNVAPDGSFKEELVEQGKVNGIINLSENIRELEGWKLSTDKLEATREFSNNISYELPIIDYAGNKSIINIDITKATYINLTYASHNSEIGWTFGHGNYDIAGDTAVTENVKFKTESIAFRFEGNVDADFMQVNSYIYTHWGEGSLARCTTSKMLYNYGYNPDKGKYKSMNSNDLVTIENKKYFQFGGGGINFANNTDINGNNPISAEIAEQFRYGICGLNIKLKDYSHFSIVYQILVDGVGWINACSDGQECMYSKNRPMTAFRISLIPKTEKQYVLDTWNKDVGTYNIKKVS